MPDEFLTIDQVAQRLALPPDMIRRRIESGDIPVHWVEADGKLEMRVAADDIVGANQTPSGSQAPPAPTYGVPRETSYEEPRAVAGENAAEEWADTGDSEYPQGLWTPVEQAADPEPGLWEAASPADLADDEPPVPVWRPDPATWDDEPLEEAAGEAPVSGFQPGPQPSAQPSAAPDPSRLYAQAEDEQDPFFVPAPSAADFAAPPAPGFSFDQTAAEPATPAGAQDEPSVFEAAESTAEPYDEEPTAFSAEAEQEALPVAPEPVTPPSALVSAEVAGAGALAINSIDARELVAGLFERWERALEQRIQAEQRLRFEAELEQRMRQVRDLRQELELTRKAQAAELAEREREMMELRNKLREQEQAPRSRGLFRR